MPKGAVYRLTERLAFEVIEGEAVVLSLETSEYFSLNRTGTCAWEVLAAGGTPDDAAEAVSGRFDVPVNRAASDVAQLIHQLVEAGLLVASP